MDGDVIAESAIPSPVSYLALRFPASDIPAQARRLFLQNRLRAIADVAAGPVPIVPEHSPLTGRPLDLTFSFLRSPAPIHLEYLRNIGVESSLTVSVLVRQQLWGLIACHHASPHPVDYSTRAVCELIGQALGSQVALRTDNAALQLQLAFRGLLDSYLAQIDAPASLSFADCFQSQPLLELFSADGLVLSVGGIVATHGHALPPAALLPVIARLRELSSNGIASSNMLSALGAGTISGANEVSGALYLGLGGETGDYLLLLRRGLVTTVTWAGNPAKSVNTDPQGTLHPRASFQAWRETVHGRSRPWSELELEGARALRAHLLQRQASLESAWSEQRFRFLADSMPQLIWTAKPDGNADITTSAGPVTAGCPLSSRLIGAGSRHCIRTIFLTASSNGNEASLLNAITNWNSVSDAQPTALTVGTWRAPFRCETIRAKFPSGLAQPPTLKTRNRRATTWKDAWRSAQQS